MATILEFQASERKPKEQPMRLRMRRDCEVVMFPGIRYERWGDGPSRDSNGRRHDRHDRLDIED